MGDFQFLQNPVSGKWVIIAPRRAKRPDESHGSEPICPFCVGHENFDEEVYRVKDKDGNGWLVRVVNNKFPFAKIHEVIIHSPDHQKSFDELSVGQNNLILQTFRQRFNEHSHKGQVAIFHNHNHQAGESLPHPHTQLAVMPHEVELDTPRLSSVDTTDASFYFETENFSS